LHIKLKNEQLLFVNDVNFEKYIAGVVEAEGGPNAPLEYFKTQAILCRTYAMKYYNKHLNEGFNLCDEVHCQAYKGRVSKNEDILKAAIETSGLVIVDQIYQLSLLHILPIREAKQQTQKMYGCRQCLI
jgi:stage II sporulation protein D